MTHDEYLAELAASRARHSRRLDEAKVEYERRYAEASEPVTAAARRRGMQARRRRNAPVLSRKKGTRTPCTREGCGRVAYCRGICKRCYYREYEKDRRRRARVRRAA